MIASIALLLSSRPFWWISIAAGVASAALVSFTWLHARSELRESVATVEERHAHYDEVRKKSSAKSDDEALIQKIEHGDDVGSVGHEGEEPSPELKAPPPKAERAADPKAESKPEKK